MSRWRLSLRERTAGNDGETLLPVADAERRGPDWIETGLIRQRTRRLMRGFRTGSNDTKVTRHRNSSAERY